MPFRWSTVILASICGCGVLLAALAFEGNAQGMLPTGLDPFGVSRVGPRQTWFEQRIESVVLQRYDEGCGPAALATVLRFLLGLDVTERELLEEMFLAKVEAGARGGGFSFRDLMGAAERRGLETLAGRAPLEELAKLTLPAIVLLDRGKLRHFVVVWGVVGDRVHLGDPLVGNTTVPLAEFGKEWLGVLLLVLPPDHQRDAAVEKVRRQVDRMEALTFRPADPFGLGFAYRSVFGEGMSLLVPAPSEF